MLIIVLDDGKTWSSLEGCQIVQGPDEQIRVFIEGGERIPIGEGMIPTPSILHTFEDEVPVILRLPKEVKKFLEKELPAPWSPYFDVVHMDGAVHSIFLTHPKDDPFIRISRYPSENGLWAIEEYQIVQFPTDDEGWACVPFQGTPTRFWGDEDLLELLQELVKYMK